MAHTLESFLLCFGFLFMFVSFVCWSVEQWTAYGHLIKSSTLFILFFFSTKYTPENTSARQICIRQETVLLFVVACYFFFFFGVSFLLVAGFSVFLVHIERVVALTVRGCGTQSWICAEFGWTFSAAHGITVWNWCRRVFWFLVKHKQWKNNNKMVLRMKMYF